MPRIKARKKLMGKQGHRLLRKGNDDREPIKKKKRGSGDMAVSILSSVLLE